MRTILSMLAIAGASLAFFAAPASAQLQTFVAATGDDARPCTSVTLPCRTLQRGIDAVATGGEVLLLSSLLNQVVAIQKSLTLTGGGHTVFGRIAVSVPAGVVTIRDLHLNGRAAVQHQIGISILDAAAMHIENCSVARYADDGIRHVASGELFVVGTVSRDNVNTGIETAGIATIDDTRLENNDFGLVVTGSGSATVTRSVAVGNRGIGFAIDTGASGSFTGVVAMGGQFGILSSGGIVLEDSAAVGNTDQGFWIDTGTPSWISNSVSAGNGIGLDANSATFTLGDNLISGNTTEVIDPPTPFTAQ